MEEQHPPQPEAIPPDKTPLEYLRGVYPTRLAILSTVLLWTVVMFGLNENHTTLYAVTVATLFVAAVIIMGIWAGYIGWRLRGNDDEG